MKATRSMNQAIQTFIRSDSAATTTEYAIMIGMLILVCLAAISTVGSETMATWLSNSENIAEAMNNS